MQFAPENIVGTRWLSPCGEVIDTVWAVSAAGTPLETLALGRECAFTSKRIGGLILRSYDELDAYTPAPREELK